MAEFKRRLSGIPTDLVSRAGTMTVGELFADMAARVPEHTAIEDGHRSLTYGELDRRVAALCRVLAYEGLQHGDRIAILSENRIEYIECALAAARTGMILGCQNWRLAPGELEHCISLISPAAIIVSERHAGLLDSFDTPSVPVIRFGTDYEERLATAQPAAPAAAIDPEDGLLILYTSGTTGLPKGALISHRAEVARLAVSQIDVGLAPGDSFVAWAPMFHMVSLEHALHVLCLGGKVIAVDGADIERVAHLVETERQWWLVLMPGMIDRLVEEIERRDIRPAGMKLCGVLADLVPAQRIAQTTRLLQAPYWNSFGSTETGMLPCAGNRFAIGEAPQSLSKRHNSLYRWRLVDEDGRDVPRGTPGEIAVRGPTVFSGYWNAPEANAKDFRSGWFHMGDMFRENPDGTVDFVDRAKYLIKSGGENIYPVEIERVLMRDPRVDDCAVVKRPDPKWGEVPVAYVALTEPSLTAEELLAACRAELAGYKCPREIRFLPSADAFPRSTTGKIQRQEIEKWLIDEAAQ